MAAVRGCEICKKMIDPERAEKLPQTTLCTEHALELRDKFNATEFITAAKQDRVGKQTSIKVLVAGVTTEMVRNTEAIEKLRAEYESQKYG